MNSYHPVSNPSFVSMVIKRAVANKPNEYLLTISYRVSSQHTERAKTETSLQAGLVDMIMVANNRKLSLLDVSATFDCVDHLILLKRFQVAVGNAFDLIQIGSFLSGRPL